MGQRGTSERRQSTAPETETSTRARVQNWLLLAGPEGSVVLPDMVQGKAFAKVISNEWKIPIDYCWKSLKKPRLRFSAVLRDHRSF